MTGYTQSGSLFHGKTRALEKAIHKSFTSATLHYPTGPIPLRPADIPGFTPSQASSNNPKDVEAFGWWRRRDGTAIYDGIEKGLQTVAATIKSEGPFDGAIGFSQGAALAGIVASLLEEGRREAMEKLCESNKLKFGFPSSFLNVDRQPIQPPLKFTIIYSGFAAPWEFYSGFYEPKIKTSMLIVVGSMDTVVDESRTKVLIECSRVGKDRVVTHPGGHFVPSGKVWLDVVAGFIRSCVEEGATREKQARTKHDERVEDMDVPF